MSQSFAMDTMLEAIASAVPDHKSLFVDLPKELRLAIYRIILREQSESGATVTISATTADGGVVENYQFPIPSEYKALLLANKRIYHEFSDEAAKVYNANNFEKDKNENFPVKIIRFNQQTLDVQQRVFDHLFRVNLLAGTDFTELLRHSVLNTALRRIECRINFIDRYGNTFPGKFSLTWSDDTSNKSRNKSRNKFTDGNEIWAKACKYVENQIRHALNNVNTNIHEGCEWSFVGRSDLPTIVADDNQYDPFDIEN